MLNSTTNPQEIVNHQLGEYFGQYYWLLLLAVILLLLFSMFGSKKSKRK